jgi:hypothetical protein
VPGCSTGEEAYSLAMIFKEAVEQEKPARGFSLQIFATDLDKDAIDRARQGLYPANIAGDVSAERLRRFFVQEEHGYQVGKEIRETVIFAPQNLIMDPPFTRLDILCCRNLLIYLAPELQKKLLPLFHYSLNPGGVLVPWQRGDHRRGHRPLRPARRQGADLPPPGGRPAERTSRLPHFAPPGALRMPNSEVSRPARRKPRPTSRPWPSSFSCSATPRPPC